VERVCSVASKVFCWTCTRLAQSVVERVFLLPRLPLVSRTVPTGEPSLTDVLGGRDAWGLVWDSPTDSSP
jgi:hypothetical protein